LRGMIYLSHLVLSLGKDLRCSMKYKRQGLEMMYDEWDL